MISAFNFRGNAFHNVADTMLVTTVELTIIITACSGTDAFVLAPYDFAECGDALNFRSLTIIQNCSLLGDISYVTTQCEDGIYRGCGKHPVT